MKIKLDENFPLALVEELGSFGHDVDTVDGEGLAGEPDESVWLAAPGRRALFERVRMPFEGEDVGSWKRSFVVAGERKLRIRRPRI